MAQAETERPLTSAKVAELLGVSPETVVSYAEQGKLAGFRLPSGHWRFHREDVDAVIGKAAS
jgi:excisionase family DNA binding protein